MNTRLGKSGNKGRNDRGFAGKPPGRKVSVNDMYQIKQNSSLATSHASFDSPSGAAIEPNNGDSSKQKSPTNLNFKRPSSWIAITTFLEDSSFGCCSCFCFGRFYA
ncbi:hypothetical protein Dsin_012967 [Dipteronia sinensis]|uniref:Uncharacterized protein n=1 Tax=Dipteronia sinensis TaxID=43782 RepID=A0AAE0AKD1_9ROSI|nr:hypothetical protein Dsin_012967 [Dipteronia sinensis]